MKTSKIEVGGLFPPNPKKKYKKWKEKESYTFIVYIIFKISGGRLLVFFDDEQTTFRNKNDRFICTVIK